MFIICPVPETVINKRVNPKGAERSDLLGLSDRFIGGVGAGVIVI